RQSGDTESLTKFVSCTSRKRLTPSPGPQQTKLGHQRGALLPIARANTCGAWRRCGIAIRRPRSCSALWEHTQSSARVGVNCFQADIRLELGLQLGIVPPRRPATWSVNEVTLKHVLVPLQ